MSDWLTRAACRDKATDLFFAEEADARGYYDRARKICARCPVKTECLIDGFALDDVVGIRAGLNQERREQMRTDATRLKIDWKDFQQAKDFLRFYSRFKRDGVRKGVNWSSKEQVNKYRNSYFWNFQPRISGLPVALFVRKRKPQVVKIIHIEQLQFEIPILQLTLF